MLIQIFYEVLTKKIYCDENVPQNEKVTLPKHLLLALENIACIRIFFFAVDDQFKFSSAFQQQMKKNQNYALQDEFIDSDDEDETGTFGNDKGFGSDR